MKRSFELLAPGGDIDSIKAAIVAGADAIYCGLDCFNARNRAVNLSFEQLNGVLKLAHQYHCQVFLTLNIIILENEIPALLRLLNKLVNTQIDGVIVQDWGLFYLLSQYFKTLVIHASTQVTTHNEGQILFLNKLGASRVNLSRELNIQEITALTSFAHHYKILSEVFVHGSYCIGFSGLCYFSSVEGGNSGNRGRCGQPCRDQYQTSAMGNNYPLNLKDNCAFTDLPLLFDAGVDSLKIEGRIKGASYVYSVVNSWSQQLQKYSQGTPLVNPDPALYKVFNRDFSDGYLQGEINKSMFIDNPRDHTLAHLQYANRGASSEKMRHAEQALYNEKAVMLAIVKDKIKDLSIAKTSLTIEISGSLDTPLTVSVTTPGSHFLVHSQSLLRQADAASIDLGALEKRFKSLNNEYRLQPLQVDKLQNDLCIPFKELTSIKKSIVSLLNGGVAPLAPIVLPVLNKQKVSLKRAKLAVVIADEQDVSLCQSSRADIYYKLPEGMQKQSSQLIALFLNNKRLIPWFPAIFIAEDYCAAIEFLKQVQPKLIVTNNTGIAYQAYQMGIPWIAGPYLNISNSFSLLSMSERFNGYGAFISNELNKNQIKNIRCPGNFKLYYPLYQPLLLMSSRQCFFQQTVGCKKLSIDKGCIQKCSRSASIINLKGRSFLIDKKKGGYPCLYSDQPFLNTDIINDLPGFFDGFFIDLTDMGSFNYQPQDKSHLIMLFENLLSGQADAAQQLKLAIPTATNAQYHQGV